MEQVHERSVGREPFELYLRDARRRPLLTATEERALARLYRDADAPPEAGPGERRPLSDAAREELIERNLRLVVSVARHYAHLGMELSDLVQEGNIGLMQAVERFDPERGIRFSTYAVWWIRQAITRALTSKSRTIRIPIHQRELARKAMRLRPALGSNRNGRLDVGELAREAGVPKEKMERALSTLINMESLDAPAVEGGSRRSDLIADDNASSPWRNALDVERRAKVDALLGLLPAREEAILRMRYAIGFADTHTLEQVGAAIHVTRERVRQLEKDALLRLRREAERQGLRSLLDG